jgi:hypothetical protein
VPKQPAFSATAGFSLGVPVPDELKGLTFAEMALISRIQVAVPARKLKLGDRALTGHVSFFDRTANIEEVADVLPRLAADVKVMEFTAQVGRAAKGRSTPTPRILAQADRLSDCRAHLFFSSG